LNERRLTRRQVRQLISSGARFRPDLSAAFEETFSTGYQVRHRVYELEGERFLFVFDENDHLGGKGDIYPADYMVRFAQWTARVREDHRLDRASSVTHWHHYSRLKLALTANIGPLIEELRARMARSADELDGSYRSLDLVSAHVEDIGIEQVWDELYDHLVAYVGEVMRARIDGRWEIRTENGPPFFPYLVGAKHDPVMPINVVWEELSGLDAVNLRAAAANEVRRKRKVGW